MKIYNNSSNLNKKLVIEPLDALYKLNHKNIVKAIPLSKEDIYDENNNIRIIYQKM